MSHLVNNMINLNLDHVDSVKLCNVAPVSTPDVGIEVMLRVDAADGANFFMWTTPEALQSFAAQLEALVPDVVVKANAHRLGAAIPST